MPLYTTGHSNHSPEGLFAILAPFGITRIIDVRSVPYSGRFPYFSKDNLKRLCTERGIVYEWWGDRLGGMRDGQPSFDEIRRETGFRNALTELAGMAHDKAGDTATCLLCAEWDPSKCHRSMLIGFELRRQPEFSVDLHHILRDGTLILQSELEENDSSVRSCAADRAGTMSLFDDSEK